MFHSKWLIWISEYSRMAMHTYRHIEAYPNTVNTMWGYVAFAAHTNSPTELLQWNYVEIPWTQNNRFKHQLSHLSHPFNFIQIFFQLHLLHIAKHMTITHGIIFTVAIPHVAKERKKSNEFHQCIAHTQNISIFSKQINRQLPFRIILLKIFSLNWTQVAKLVFFDFVAQNDLTSSKYKRNKRQAEPIWQTILVIALCVRVRVPANTTNFAHISQ